jgi:hypothetical protein
MVTLITEIAAVSTEPPLATLPTRVVMEVLTTGELEILELSLKSANELEIRLREHLRAGA